MATKYADLGKWMSYARSIKSEQAIKHGVDNMPSPAQYERMKLLYKHIYAPLCEHFSRTVPFNSFFRCPRLNTLVRGSNTSEHKLGGAIDLDCDDLGKVLTNKEVFKHILAFMDFDQLILESPDKSNRPRWVHVGYRPTGNRHEVLVMRRDADGNPEYFPYEHD